MHVTFPNGTLIQREVGAMALKKKTKVDLPIAVRRRPRQHRSMMTVDAILEAARKLFIRDGFEATSTTRIAEAAGVSVGSL
jgi:hypothetical protein